MYHSISAIISCSARRRVLSKVLLKPADALVAANECLKSLGLKYLVQTRNVFVVAKQSTANCCNKSVRAKVRNNEHIHSFLRKLTSHDDKLPTFSAFWFDIVKISSRF